VVTLPELPQIKASQESQQHHTKLDFSALKRERSKLALMPLTSATTSQLQSIGLRSVASKAKLDVYKETPETKQS